MALSLNEKIRRVSDFLIAFSYRRVWLKMQASGMTKAEIKRGWGFVQEASEPYLVDEPSAFEGNPAELLDALDGWENQHYDVIEAVLGFDFPAIRDEVFAGLSRTDGPELIVSVNTLVRRVVELKGAKGKRGKAFTALVAHGVTEEVLGQATKLLKQVQAGAKASNEQVNEETLEEIRARREKATAELWGWYRKWSTIARARITDGHVLRMLGFGRPGRPRKGDEPNDGGGEPVLPVTPVEPETPADG